MIEPSFHRQNRILLKRRLSQQDEGNSCCELKLQSMSDCREEMLLPKWQDRMRNQQKQAIQVL